MDNVLFKKPFDLAVITNQLWDEAYRQVKVEAVIHYADNYENNGRRELFYGEYAFLPTVSDEQIFQRYQKILQDLLALDRSTLKGLKAK